MSFRPEQSGVEESTTWDNEPPQDKTSNSGRFLDSLCSGRNDNFGAFLRIRPLFHEHFTLPRGPHQARPGEPASPEGSSCTVLLGGIIQPHRLYLQRGGRQIAAPTVSLMGGTIHPHGLYSGRPRNGTQAVPYGFAGRSVFSTVVV